MPTQTQEAVNWALGQAIETPNGKLEVSADTHIALVTEVRQYFNDHGIEYSTFSYNDLKPFLN